MLAVVGVSALGAASDPGTGRADTASWTDIHLAAALAGLCIIAWTYYRAWLNIADNQRVIERIVAQVQQIRAERGLDDPAPLETADSAVGGVVARGKSARIVTAGPEILDLFGP